MHNNDPRIVKKTVPVEQLSFDEAAELAYFGAKILHPTCIWPTQQQNVPVKLLNTMQPLAAGTVIQKTASIQRGESHCGKRRYHRHQYQEQPHAAGLWISPEDI